VRVFADPSGQVTPQAQIVRASVFALLRNPPRFAHQLPSARKFFLFPLKTGHRPVIPSRAVKTSDAL
jgi:hypothetical protein